MMRILQVVADTFIYTPLNVGLFFALMTLVEGGRWKVSIHQPACKLLLCNAGFIASQPTLQTIAAIST